MKLWEVGRRRGEERKGGEGEDGRGGQWGKKRREDGGRELGNKGRRRRVIGGGEENRKEGRREGEERSNNQPEVMNKQDLCCKPSPLNLTSTSILPSMGTGESISRTIISVDLKFLNPVHSLEGSKALQWYL